jgi:hypothetical protein
VQDLRASDLLSSKEEANFKFTSLIPSAKAWTLWLNSPNKVNSTVQPAFFYAGEVSSWSD